MLLLLIAFLLLLVLNFPVALAAGLASALSMWLVSGVPLIVLVQRMVVGIDSFVFLAIPLFILTGKLMNAGGITERIFSFARLLIGRITGGLAQANVVASIIFSGMSGSAVADAGGLGAIEIEAMDKQGYPKEFSASVTVASSVIGPVIPPSIPLVLYGALAEVSVGRLFVGGIVPGLLVGLSLMVLVHFLSKKHHFPKDPPLDWKTKWLICKRAVLPLMTPVLILGGIISGQFTPTEAAAIAAGYALFISFFVYRSIKVADLPKIFLETMVLTSLVTFIMSTASSLSYVLLLEDIGGKLVGWLTAISQNKFVILFFLNLILLFFGCIMDAGIALILLVPILTPLLHEMQIDLIHFGVLLTLNLMIGVATPPVGMSLFVVSEVAKIKLERLMSAIIPFLLPPLIVLILITYLPKLVLFLPNAVYGAY